MLALFVIQAAVSCIRFEHVQRSKLVRDHGSWLEFHCLQGKSRRKGARPAYNWATPPLTFLGINLVAELRQFFLEEALPGRLFLWPAVDLSRDDLWQVSEATAFRLERKMSGTRFLEIARGIISQCGVESSAAAATKFNKFRRFLPTGAQVLNMHPQDSQAIGSWVEMPGASSASKVQTSRQDLMSTHYSGERVLASMRAKSFVVQAVLQHPVAMQMSRNALPPDSLKWPGFSGSLSRSPPPCEVPTHEEGQVQQRTSESQDSSSSSDESQSTSSADSGQNCLLQEVTWIQQRQKIHIVREEDLDSRPVPWCRTKAFPQDPSARGKGVTDDMGHICQKCLRSVPSGLSKSLLALHP